ncbi:MAG: S9 family peptidase, partial [Rhodothermaceae bacterium]|nr:S9 family peptidase [Rhodothermaceae bacterium]
MNPLVRRLSQTVTLFSLLLMGLFISPQSVLAQEGYQTPPPALAKLADAPATPGVSLSPDRTMMLLMEQPSLPSIAELSQPEMRLAGLRINPRTNGPSRSRGYTGLTLRSLGGEIERAVTGLPDGELRIRNVRWAPDGRHIAFTLDEQDRIDLYVAPVADGKARRAMDAMVNAAGYGAAFQWASDSEAIIVRTVPADRPAPPAAPDVPSGPIVQENVGKVAPARTYQDLLGNPHDEALFEHYITAQLARVGLDGSMTPLGEPALMRGARPSPDGRYILVETIERPYSYLVPASRFPRRIAVWDRDGNTVATIAELPLAEEVPTAFGSVPTGVRSVQWRADKPAMLAWVEALDGGDARAEADYRDQVYLLDAPFEAAPTPLVKLRLRYAGMTWGDDDLALANESWWSTRKRRVYRIDPGRPGADPEVVFDLSSEDRYNDPGYPVTHTTDRGTRVLTTADGGTAIFLRGGGASPEGNRPFVRKMDLQSGETEELFRSEAPAYEYPVAVLDAAEGKIITRRETVTDTPNYYLRDLEAGTMTALTDFQHPYPELAEVQKELIHYERADGVPLTALYLPAGYDAERDGPL